jgi:hypothetical protein
MLNKVFTAEHISEAGLIRSYLEQHEIPSQLRNEYASGVLGDLPFMTSSPEVWVDSSFAQEAKSLITELNQNSAQGADWTCSTCDEPNPSNFSSCWNCQAIEA